MGKNTASMILSDNLDSYGGYIFEGICVDILTKSQTWTFKVE